MSTRRGGQAMTPARKEWTAWATAAVAAALVLLTVLVYAPVRQYDFVEIDDPLYVRENPHVSTGLSLENVRWAFTSQHAAYWIPLTWVSYMVDVELFGGARPGGHHVTNLALHALNTLVLFLLLRRTTAAPIRSAFVAALFAVHPLHVESVAWITERKDVLSTLFWFLGLWAYAWYADRPGWRRYLAVAACVALGLLAKPMLVTFPFVLLLMDAWPLRRARFDAKPWWPAWRPRLVEKLPLLVFVLAASGITYVAQQQFGAAPTLEALPLSLRVQNAVVSYVAYLGMMLWPSPLTVIYPLAGSIPAVTVAGAAAVLLALTACVVWAGRRRPYLPVGWFWYVGTLVPVIGIVQVGVQARADRFTYVPLVGIFVVLVWAAADAAGLAARRRVAAVAGGLLIVTASSVQARHQLGYWTDSVALWSHAVEHALGMSKFEAHRSLARILAGQGRTTEAVGHLENAVRLQPASVETRLELARSLATAGRTADAVAELEAVTRARPDAVEAHAALGELLTGLDRLEAAVHAYETALRLEPDLGSVHNNLGSLLARQGRMTEAVSHFEEAARLGPDVEMARVNLGLALASLGRLAEARAIFISVLQRNPRNPVARRAVEELPGR